MVNNKLRKLIGMAPKNNEVVNKDGIISTTSYYPDFSVKEINRYVNRDGKKIKEGVQNAFYPDGKPMSVSRYQDNEILQKTEYHEDGSQTITEFSGKYSHKTHIDANGTIAYKDRLFDDNDKPVTDIFARQTRKSAHINAYVNGYRLGQTIGIGHASRSRQDLESLRQNALYNSALNAIKNNDNDKLEEITKQLLKQKELADNPEFQSCLEQAYAKAKEKISGNDIHAFQAAFLEELNKSGYMDMSPTKKVDNAINRTRNNIKMNEQKTTVVEDTKSLESTEQKENKSNKITNSVTRNSGMEI